MPLATASRGRAPTAGDVSPTHAERRRPAWIPSPSRRGRPALAAAGLLIVVVCAAAGAALAGTSGRQQAFLDVARAVPEGAPLTAADIGTVELDPSTGLSVLPASEEAAVIGKRAAFPLAAGTLLAPAALTTGAVAPAGDAVVGASLEPQQVPAELQPGDTVLVVLSGTTVGGAGTGGATATGGSPVTGARTGSQVGSDQPGAVLAEGTVLDVVLPAAGGLDAGPTSSTTLVDLAVPLASAAVVASASAGGDVSLALVPAATTSGRRS